MSNDRSLNVSAVLSARVHNQVLETSTSKSTVKPTSTPKTTLTLTPTPPPTVRLVNGSSSSEGRLEVYYNSTWGTVCDDTFEDVDARVACHSLGYG